MADNFLRAERDQPFLLPPDLRDWLPAGQLAWFVLDVDDQLDLARSTGRTGMTGTATRLRPQDPARRGAHATASACAPLARSTTLDRGHRLRVLGANPPRHVTIARFRVRHQQALADFLVASFKLCEAAGMVRLGVVALDATKVAANTANTAPRQDRGRGRRDPAAGRRGRPAR